MTSKSTIYKILGTALFTITLTACGGSDSGGGEKPSEDAVVEDHAPDLRGDHTVEFRAEELSLLESAAVMQQDNLAAAYGLGRPERAFLEAASTLAWMMGRLQEAELLHDSYGAATFPEAVNLLTDEQMVQALVNLEPADGAHACPTGGEISFVPADHPYDVFMTFDACGTKNGTLNGELNLEFDHHYGATQQSNRAWSFAVLHQTNGGGEELAVGALRVFGDADVAGHGGDSELRLGITELLTRRDDVFLGIRSLAVEIEQSGGDYDVIIGTTTGASGPARLASNADGEAALAGYITATTRAPERDLSGHPADRLTVDYPDRMAAGCFENGALRIAANGSALDVLYGHYAGEPGRAQIWFGAQQIGGDLDIEGDCSAIDNAFN